ncbi:MAG: ribosomal RNA small subunit methyltransferase A [SAR324 cluster bacterium]|nr:ribosomal RNA small subunit methyltransferase A [SAR324 cluster bacterium]
MLEFSISHKSATIRYLNKAIKPKRGLSQNFLIDTEVLSIILTEANINSGDAILEIGAGDGFLTDALLRKGGKVVAVEVDPTLSARLATRHAKRDDFSLITADILSLKLDDIVARHPCRKWKVVANLPYHISTPILFALLSARHLFVSMVLMFQQEFALRITTPLGSKNKKNLSSLSVASQWAFDVKLATLIDSESFYPKPKVDSALVTLTPKGSRIDDGGVEEEFFTLVRKFYQHRRKTIKASLKIHYPNHTSCQELFTDHLLMKKRPEDLLWPDWFSLFHKLHHKSLSINHT